MFLTLCNSLTIHVGPIFLYIDHKILFTCQCFYLCISKSSAENCQCTVSLCCLLAQHIYEARKETLDWRIQTDLDFNDEDLLDSNGSVFLLSKCKEQLLSGFTAAVCFDIFLSLKVLAVRTVYIISPLAQLIVKSGFLVRKCYFSLLCIFQSKR